MYRHDVAVAAADIDHMGHVNNAVYLRWVQDAVEPVAGVKSVAVKMTFDPPWGMDMMSDEARLELGFM